MSWRRKGDAVDIADWLRGLGLEKYASAFDENAINWDVLSELTTDDLKDIGVAAGGDCRSRRGCVAGCAAAATVVRRRRGRATPADGDVLRSGWFDAAVDAL